MQYGKPLLTLLFAGSLVACTTTPTSQSVQRQTLAPPVPKYVSAQSVPPINVPVVSPDGSAQQTDYSVSATSTTAASSTSTTVSLAPPGSNLQQAANPQPVAPANQTMGQAVTNQNPQTAAAPAASTSSGGRVALAVNMNYSQTWSQLKKVLPTAGYPVMEEDNFSGTYYVLDKVSSNGVIKRDTPIYQLHLEKRGDKTTVVTVLNNQNQPADSAVATRILTAVKKSI